MTSARRRVSWLPMVRAAIPRCVEPFTSFDVCRAIDQNVGENARQGVLQALCRLAELGELTKETRKRGETRSVSFFTRTATFGAEEFDFEAQNRAAAFLQGLTVLWGSRRNRNHAAAE